MSELKMINMRLPIKLIERVDSYKKEKGFSNRTQTIIYLIQRSLDEGN